MNKPDPKAFEEKLLTIDVIDGLRREQERFDIALNDAGRMQELRVEIQSYYAQAGITVSDELIDKAIAERQAQRFVFKPPALGPLGHLFASAYIHRGYVVATVAVVAVATFSGWYADRQYTRYQEEQALAAYRNGLQQQLTDIQSSESAVNALPASLPSIESALVPALPNWSLELQAAYQQARLPLDEAATCWTLTLPNDLPLGWSGENQLAGCQSKLPGIRTNITRAQQLVVEHRELTNAVTGYGLLEQRLAANASLLDWNAIATTSVAARNATAIGSNRQQFTTAVGAASAAVNELSTTIDAHTAATGCLTTAIGHASGNDRGTLTGLLSEGQAFKQGASIAGIGDWSTRATNTCEFFNTGLTLRIVSEAGEQSGVWRYYGNDRNARTYYLVVDAMTAGGGNGTAMFKSTEDQKAYRQHRFGVRVSERVFESVRRDKEADGVLDASTVGGKPANSLSWNLDAGVEPGFIAEW